VRPPWRGRRDTRSAGSLRGVPPVPASVSHLECDPLFGNRQRTWTVPMAEDDAPHPRAPSRHPYFCETKLVHLRSTDTRAHPSTRNAHARSGPAPTERLRSPYAAVIQVLLRRATLNSRCTLAGSMDSGSERRYRTSPTRFTTCTSAGCSLTVKVLAATGTTRP
jgi:hypothetical protein